MKRALVSFGCASMFLWCSAAHADDAGALIVYNEAVKLMGEKRYEEACPRFEASFRLAPAVRTKMAVALCQERAGRIATAWAHYREAVRLAKQANDDVSRDAADARAATLEPRLPKLRLRVASPAPRTTVLLDGRVRPAATLDQPLPLDPGRHVVRAEAAGYAPFEREITLAEGAQETVEIPELAATNDAPKVASPSGATPSPNAGREPVPWWGWTSFGLAVASVGVGAGFGLAAVSADEGARERCPSSPCRDKEGVDASESADTRAWVSNIAFGVAVAFVAVGVVSIVTRAPRAKRSPMIAGTPAFVVRF